MNKLCFLKIIAQMFKFERQWVFYVNIQSLVTDDVSFNIQKYKENVKHSTFSKKLIFPKQKGNFLKGI